jgi:hypothetical protein
MVPTAATNALLLITHSGGGRWFDYGEHWVGTDLIYTGRGKLGDQRRDDARRCATFCCFACALTRRPSR